MKEIKNIFSSIICVVKTKPLYLVVKFFTIINSVIASLIPVFVIEEIVNIFYDNRNIGKMAVLVGLLFLGLAAIGLINFLLDLYDQHVRRIFIAKESIVFYKKLSGIRICNVCKSK